MNGKKLLQQQLGDDTFHLIVTSSEKCSCYTKGDEFELEGTMFTALGGNAVCLKLAKDVLDVVEQNKIIVSGQPETLELPCNGCEGTVAFEYTVSSSGNNVANDEQIHHLEELAKTLGRFSLFKVLNKQELRKVLPKVTVGEFEEGAAIIEKGQWGRNLYIVESGTVEVRSGENGSVLLSILGKGEIFGEMSLLSGNRCSATVYARDRCRLLAIDGQSFGRMVERYPSLQKYLFGLLTTRLNHANTISETELVKGIKGNLDDVQIAEVVQMLHMSRKSGSIHLNLPGGPAIMVMKEGDPIYMRYDDYFGIDAFFEILKENEGTFFFSQEIPAESDGYEKLGDFMSLLMEAFVKIDESRWQENIA